MNNVTTDFVPLWSRYKREHSNSITTHKHKILGKTRHHIFTNKEWKDSTYNYNKTNLRELPSKYKLTDKLIRYHFNIDDLRHTARSRRMRSLIIRSSSKRIFIAKPEIKQTSDKTIITIYAFDRQKQSLIRNLYFFNRNRYIRNSWLINKNQRIFRKHKNIKPYLNKHNKRNKQIRGIKNRFPYQNLKLRNEIDFLRLRFSSLYKKFSSINNSFILLYIYSLLSFFNIRILFPLKNKGNKENSDKIKGIINNKPELLIVVNNKYNKLTLLKKDNINLKNLNLINYQQSSNVSKMNANKEKLNYFLLNFLHNKLNYSNIINKEQVALLNLRLKNNFYNKILTKYLKSKSKMLSYFAKLELNKLKYNSLLINLKRFISKVYDKNTELNIINLKYVYLNSDIYSQLIANKLRRKTKIAWVLAKSIRLVKMPYHFLFKITKNNFNDFQELNRYRDSKLTNRYYDINKKSINNRDRQSSSLDRLDIIFKSLFPSQQIHNKSNDQFKQGMLNNRLFKKSKIINVLNTIKHKWVKGIRLEVVGRLTRRNTASKSMFKFKSKGNLNNKQYYFESNLLYSLSPVMLRNNSKDNLQYTQVKSKRRIGAFGVNSWISSY